MTDADTSAEEYVRSSVHTFLSDPPDSEFQAGFLGALLVIARDVLGQRMDEPPFVEAQELQEKYLNGNS